MCFPRLTRDLTLPIGLVLLSQITRNAQMFWDQLSLQPLCNAVCEQEYNASAEICHPRQRGRKFRVDFVLLLHTGTQELDGSRHSFWPSCVCTGRPHPCRRQAASVPARDPSATETRTLMHERHQKTSRKASLWVRPLPDQPVYWDCYAFVLFICKLLPNIKQALKCSRKQESL